VSLGAFVALCLGVAGTVQYVSAQAAFRPNIIFIMADDLGYGDIGAFGQQLIQTPSLDKMAKEGKLFTRFYSGSTVCAPSRCVLMTGLHTGHCRVRGNSEFNNLAPEDITVAEVLKEAGYITGGYGKWGLGNHDSTGVPYRQGFDEYYGYWDQTHAHEYYPPFLVDNQDTAWLRNEGAYSNRGKGQCSVCVDYSHDLIANKAIDFIDRHKDTTFFLYAPFTIPHTKFQVPDLGIYANESWTNDQKIQAAMITRMDKDIGRIFDKLKEHGIDENTIVFFTSDNGPHGSSGTLTTFDANGPLRGRKRDLYEGGIRVPTIVRWPGVIEAGTTSGFVGWFADILPTLAELGGINYPEGLDGISLVNELIGNPEEQAAHEYLYWEFWEQGNKKAVFMDDWKAVWLQNESIDELYNLGNDLAETTDIQAANMDVFNTLSALKDASHEEGTTVLTWEPQLVKPAVIRGCMDTLYGEYDADVNIHDSSACVTLNGGSHTGSGHERIFDVSGRNLYFHSSGKHHIRLYSVEGQLLYEVTGTGAMKYTLDAIIKTGIYVITVITDGSAGIRKMRIL
jgi:uncharacterized sulfatase